MKIELTIKVDYLPGWGLFEGVRELLQNAKDAETEFNAPMTVRMRGAKGELGTLVIENEGCTLPYEALLLGHSTKTQRGDLIGQFGEGLKLSVLALLRAGHSVKIRNGSEVWQPEIMYSSKFDANVLAFDIQKGRKDDNRIQIEIGGITPEMYAEEIRPKFLWLAEVPEAQQVKTEYGSILLGKSHVGKVFVKGILVETMPELTVGYNLDNADVDRDRRMVNSFDFGWKARCIWQEALRIRPDLFSTFDSILESNGLEAKQVDSYSAARFPKEFVQHTVDIFASRHGKLAVPVSNLGESEDLEHMGRTGVVVNPALRAMLEESMGPLCKVKEELKNEVVRTYSWHELDENQKANLRRAVKLVNEESPIDLSEVNVVDFRSTDLYGTFGESVSISAAAVRDSAKCLEVMVHEVAHRAGGDGEKRHVAEIERIWSGIVANLTSN